MKKYGLVCFQKEDLSEKFVKEEVSPTLTVYRVQNKPRVNYNFMFSQFARENDLIGFTNQPSKPILGLITSLIKLHQNNPKSFYLSQSHENQMILSDPGFLLSMSRNQWFDTAGFSPFLRLWSNKLNNWAERAFFKGYDRIKDNSLNLHSQDKVNSSPKLIHEFLKNDEFYFQNSVPQQNFINYKKPDFLIIGAQKSSTTSIVKGISEHPQIFTPQILKEKSLKYEFHYYSRKFKTLPLKWYESHFYHSSKKVSGEKSPSYFSDLSCHQRIYEHNPNIKLIISLRNPVDRAWSAINHYYQKRSKWAQDSKFKGLNASGIYDFISNDIEKNKTESVLENGVYIHQFENLMKYFSKDQILIFIHERMHLDPQNLQDRLFEFLEVDKIPNVIKPYYNKGTYTSERSKDSTEKLREYFRPYNEKLFDYLGEEIEEWK